MRTFTPLKPFSPEENRYSDCKTLIKQFPKLRCPGQRPVCRYAPTCYTFKVVGQPRQATVRSLTGECSKPRQATVRSPEPSNPFTFCPKPSPHGQVPCALCPEPSAFRLKKGPSSPTALLALFQTMLSDLHYCATPEGIVCDNLIKEG